MPTPSRSSAQTPGELFVAPNGNDRWSGRLAAPNRRRTDGPLATLARARTLVQEWKRRNMLQQTTRIVLRGGTYRLTQPLQFAPGDGPAQGGNIIFAAYPGETPVLSGGKPITGWTSCKVGQRTAWMTRLPEVRRGKWNFTQLWVNGRRAPRPRLPRQGLYRIAGLPTATWEGPQALAGQDRFEYREGDIHRWTNLDDVECVALHFWIESRMRFKSLDTASRMAYLTHPTRMRLSDDNERLGAPYYVENVFEALETPGQWYLDRPLGILYYLPRPGERPDNTEIIAPVLPQLIVVRGNPEKQAPVRGLHFEGLSFAHTEWERPEDRAAAGQAACHLPGMISLGHAERCSFRNCRIEHAGSYGVELIDGCSDIDLLGNTITDLAGGGVKVWHTCRRTTIADNEIADGGHRFHQAVGVLIGQSSGNKILHNHIHHFFYTGISVGWTWGYAESHAYGNIVEYNHVHHIGQGLLSDMGGIYTLGVSPGTRIRYNLFHDVESRGYGGWAIYTDEGSTDILIENNLSYRTKSAVFHQHYGKNNIIRNNIFAFGREAQIARSRIEEHPSFTFTRNIVYYTTGELLSGNWTDPSANLDGNLYFDASGRPVTFGGRTLKRWRALGVERHSRIADPLFRDPERGDFTLAPESPALAMGFIPFDLSTVGPRRKPEFGATPLKTPFVRRWLVSRALPSAGNLAALAYPKSRAALRFKPRVFQDTLCDLHEDLFADKTRDVLAYAACSFTCFEPMKLALCLAYDGPVKVWLDGKRVFQDPRGTNPCGIDKAVIPCKARAGEHDLLIAMTSNSGKAWGIKLRLWRQDVSASTPAGLCLPAIHV